MGSATLYLKSMNDKTEVLYNGSCPICSREVNLYADLSARAALPIRYDDLSDACTLADWNVSAEEAAKRLHVRKNGRLYVGIPAFIIVWRDIPQTRWLAKLVSLPGVHWVANKVYDHILAPALYTLHRRRLARG